MANGKQMSSAASSATSFFDQFVYEILVSMIDKVLKKSQHRHMTVSTTNHATSHHCYCCQ